MEELIWFTVKSLESHLNQSHVPKNLIHVVQNFQTLLIY